VRAGESELEREYIGEYTDRRVQVHGEKRKKKIEEEEEYSRAAGREEKKKKRKGQGRRSRVGAQAIWGWYRN
jgi:hypothetical protein